MAELGLKGKILAYLKVALRYLVLRVFLVALGISLLVGLSFIIWPAFTPTAFSELLVWTGIGIAMVAGILTFSSTVGGRDFGTPGMFIRSAHVQTIIDFNIEARQQIEQRFDFRIQFFLVGACIFGLGVLVQVIFAG